MIFVKNIIVEKFLYYWPHSILQEGEHKAKDYQMLNDFHFPYGEIEGVHSM